MGDNRGTRFLVVIGVLLMLAGAADPLEGSVLIAAGSLLGALGVKLGGRPGRRPALAGVAVVGGLSLGLPVLAILWKQPLLLVPFGLVAVGVLLFLLGVLLGERALPGLVYAAAALTTAAVAWMFVLSAMGGFGGDTGRSAWWALTLVPFPCGWGLGLFSLGRMARSGARHGARPT